MKKLSIILPQYNEDEETCFGCLNMLDSQIFCTWSDYEVIIVNDCSKVKLSPKFLKQFKNIKPHYISTEKNSGPGIARQVGLDAAKGEFVTFIDIDDIWFNNCVLMIFETQIYPRQKNMLMTKWLEASKMPGGPFGFIEHGQDFTWMFGKFFKRSFLKNANIRHHEELRVHEDSYFNRIAALHCADTDMEYFDFTTYVWRISEDSITRNNDGVYALNSLATYIRAVDLVLDRALIVKKDVVPQMAIEQLVYWYYGIHNKEWQAERANEWKPQTENMLSYFIIKWSEYLDTIEPDRLLMIHRGMIQQSSSIPKETYDDWYNRLKSLDIKDLPDYTQPDTTIFKLGNVD